ncbi:hypothetical protein BT93_K2251 [Corymbia citriodora subsp. variegata]|nr:hypothetical protein BT93_K2251 [Corymbia citriodora subsp. variegata]KAF8008520.1 hypothetical protein BT93_K2251 [Corymbia citriodora subsp. variegata]KAF8008526.1 hypothetical protein BT93_K2251 [Corymbia citriodora subsp. variegata]
MSVASVALSPVLEDYLNFPGKFSLQYAPLLDNLILICLSVTGSVILMCITESDSIASVKLKIQTYRGFFVRKQKLVFDGRELARNNSRVQDYGVADGKMLHLVVRLSVFQAITVRTACGKEFEFRVERSKNVGYVKRQIVKKGQGSVSLEDQELVCDGEELEDQRLIHDICRKNGNAVIQLLVCKSAKVRAEPVEKHFEVLTDASDLNELASAVGEYQSWDLLKPNIKESRPLPKDFLLEPFIINQDIELPCVLKELIESTFQGLERGNEPIRSSEGSGGAYLMQDFSGLEYVSVFKPIDEEPMALNNPQGLPFSLDGQGLKKGTHVGEGARREVAAYILDHPAVHNSEKGFAGVPPTVMVMCMHREFNYPEGYENTDKNFKIGSLQMFMKNIGSCEDMGPQAFPVNEVHKISVLDIRLANADRHAGNILISRDGEDGCIVLIPIDHGYCLPENVLQIDMSQDKMCI